MSIVRVAEVISAKQELQQWKEEVKKTLSEYHTTEGKGQDS